MEKISNNSNALEISKRVFFVIAILFAFLLSLNLMGGSFKLMGKDVAQQIISITSNPFIGLFVGLLATAIIQSSSTSTSMIVAIVASGSLTLENAVPMIMGANIGTSVTSSIVALGHVTEKEEFKKAIGAATVHDFFNLIVVAIIFPLEYFTGFLSGLGHYVAGLFYSEAFESKEMFSILGVTVKPVGKWIISFLGKNALIIFAVSMVGLIFSLRGFTAVLKKLLIGNSQKALEKHIFGNPVKSLTWGALITASVQSSSVTTSLTVPLVAADKASLKQVFPFLMGANIGTTVTALIAALSQTEAALSVAFCHLFFNLIGVLLLFPIRSIRNIPIFLAETLGTATLRNRMVGFAYIIITFFAIPFVLIFFTSDVKAQKPQKGIVKEVKVEAPKTVKVK